MSRAGRLGRIGHGSRGGGEQHPVGEQNADAARRRTHSERISLVARRGRSAPAGPIRVLIAALRGQRTPFWSPSGGAQEVAARTQPRATRWQRPWLDGGSGWGSLWVTPDFAQIHALHLCAARWLCLDR